MRKTLSIIAIILSLTVGLLLFSSCKSQLLEENNIEEANDSRRLEAKIEEDLEKTEEENKEDDTENQINSNNQEENEIEYFNNFTLLDLDKNEVSLSDFQGKIVVLNFWATWCPPCREEVPDFIEVNNLYKDKDVQIIGVSIDTDMKALEDFVEEFGINYLTLIEGTVDQIKTIWGIRAIPTTFILDKNGGVMFKNVGMMTKGQLIEILDEVLKMSD